MIRGSHSSSMKAVVQIPSYQEGANVLTTGEAIADQPRD